MKILAIETSCDETGIALVEDGRRIHADVVASQVALHAPTGGIVPDIMISITPENEMKLMAQAEQIYKQGEDPKSAIDEKSRVKDEVLERALELLRAREVLGNLNTQEG